MEYAACHDEGCEQRTGRGSCGIHWFKAIYWLLKESLPLPNLDQYLTWKTQQSQTLSTSKGVRVLTTHQKHQLKNFSVFTFVWYDRQVDHKQSTLYSWINRESNCNSRILFFFFYCINTPFHISFLFAIINLNIWFKIVIIFLLWYTVAEILAHEKWKCPIEISGERDNVP